MATAADKRFNSGLVAIRYGFKLACLLVLSIFILGSHKLHAHEIEPAIVEVSKVGNQLQISAEISAEAFLAGVDLSTTTDTETSDNNIEYDALRALSADQLAAEFASEWPQLQQLFMLMVNGEPQTLELLALKPQSTSNIELARASQLELVTDLPAGRVEINFGWDASLGVMVLRRSAEEGGFAGYIDPGEISPPINLTPDAPQSSWAAFVTFIPVGFDHILPKGLDHILFVVGLFLLSASLRPLAWQITAFTAAHTITLALASLSLVTISPAIVEPLIAISIAYVAVENIFTPKMTRWRPALVFAFGLLHGLGFASVLADFGLPGNGFIAALLGFNVGVEIGQLVVIFICFASFGYWFKDYAWYRSRITIPISVLIAVIGVYWAYERIFL